MNVSVNASSFMIGVVESKSVIKDVYWLLCSMKNLQVMNMAEFDLKLEDIKLISGKQRHLRTGSCLVYYLISNILTGKMV